MKNQSYYNEQTIVNTNKLRNVLMDFPDFALDFFTGIENNTSTLTRLNYAYDLRIFFNWALTQTNLFRDKNELMDLEVKDLERFRTTHFERYMSYLTSYLDSDGNVVTNGERGKARKIASVRSFFKYYFRHEMISVDLASKIQMPKIHEKPIIRLEDNEVVKFLNMVNSGYGLEGHQKGFHKHTKVRDVAIMTLLLGTGIRVSECVGLNVNDVDFSLNAIKITRKGGNQVILYFSDEVKIALFDWIEQRSLNENLKNESALFVSLQNKRISTRAVEKLVKKYAEIVTPLKHITPHKLRSTYGTKLYHATQDIYVVADVLGHKDVNTTKKHYAAISDDIRRNASKAVSLYDN
ncbi:MAG: tyrosine-type recombinase/integrase [Clostridia bacterium]|nr:tyrosine-type recombinase/integrase [Clostridia bacterium]